MIPLEAAVLDVAEFLDGAGVPYMIIGGFATLHWGRPRLTQDVDLKISLAEERWPSFTTAVAKRFEVLVPDPLEMLARTRVLPVRTRVGVPVDFVVAGLPYEEQAIARAIGIPVAGGWARLCTAEDLILHKIVSDRARDRDDVEGVVARQGRALDREYLDPRVKDLANGLERPDLLAFYRDALAQAGIPD